MINDIYEQYPTYKNDIITLRQTTLDDAKELLKCCSDEKAVPFFNSEFIITEVIPDATERIASLKRKGYLPLNKKPMIYDHYFIREKR
ncbi:hypothetical protein ACF3M2_19705 [Tissierella carlieri]|uniref:hypothetical protein n=1 Tax=Tissierella carlieri TaxID=689904 RepID=UPI00386A1A20